MLSWVVKVVPQPPEHPPKKVDEQKEEKPAAAPPPAVAPPPAPVSLASFGWLMSDFWTCMLTSCHNVLFLGTSE